MTPQLIEEPSLPSLAPRPRRLPHSLELTVLFRELIHFWTGLKTEIPESQENPALEEPVEFATRWKGSVKGTLVLRTSRRFVENLTRALDEKGKKTQGGNALLQEMATLYSIFLVHYAWMDEMFQLGPILARPSRPDLWPSDEPHAFCRVQVAGEPVEIRLWINLAAENPEPESQKG